MTKEERQEEYVARREAEMNEYSVIEGESERLEELCYMGPSVPQLAQDAGMDNVTFINQCAGVMIALAHIHTKAGDSGLVMDMSAPEGNFRITVMEVKPEVSDG